MKRRWLLLVFLLLSLGLVGCAAPCSDDPACTRVLFIGNSYTSTNDLPQTLVKLAEAGGKRLETGMIAPGGWTLAQHAASSATLDQISGSKWHFVVLQEQSQIPASEPARQAQMFPAIRSLAAKIKAEGATPLLFVTWGHQTGWPENNLPTYENMQLQIDQGYVEIGEALNLPIAPVGFAWYKRWKADPQLDLWQPDGSHPNLQGTYLAACVFYAVLYRESPAGLSYTAGLTRDQAQVLQKVAGETVLNEPTRWNLP